MALSSYEGRDLRTFNPERISIEYLTSFIDKYEQMSGELENI